MNLQALQRITTPQHRKGATEEHIFANNQKAHTTAKLIASIMKAKEGRE